MVSKYFVTRFAFLFTHGSCRCKFPVQLNRDFFISGLTGVHYWALKTFKLISNNLSDTRFEKKRTSNFSSDKLALELRIVWFPNFKRETNLSWRMKTELRGGLQCWICVHFLKLLLKRDICYEILHLLKKLDKKTQWQMERTVIYTQHFLFFNDHPKDKWLNLL